MLAAAAALPALLALCLALPLSRAQIERGFNETCAFDDQCTDFRLKCSGEGRCECVKYYHWDEFSKQCLTHKDLKYMLIDMEEKHDTSGRLIAETSRVFTGMMWTGLAVMIVGLLLGSGCLFYGCCYSRVCCTSRRDKLSDDRSPTGPSPRTQQAAVPGSLGARAVTQGAGVDYIPALYDTTSFDII